MGIPLEIRQVPRPKNTIVIDYGRDSPKRYGVRDRKGYKYVPNGNPQPINGKVIGHIFDGKFWPIKEQVKPKATPTEHALQKSFERPLRYGTDKPLLEVSKEVFEELATCFDLQVAVNIMALALLRIIKPEASVTRLKRHYENGLISKAYPGAHLSKNSITDLYDDLGDDQEGRYQFARLRLQKIPPSEHLLIDGMLKTNDSKVNELSSFSRKSRITGRSNISMMYAYNVEQEELVCGSVYPGDATDVSVFRKFVENNNITHGTIIADKGFSPRKIEAQLSNNKDLSYLIPVRRNDKRIASCDLLKFEEQLKDLPHSVGFKKVQISPTRWLYAFRDSARLVAELSNKLLPTHLLKKGESQEDVLGKVKDFGVIVFESNLDADPGVVYKMYDMRWEIELIFRHIKHNLEQSTTRVHATQTIVGAEFVNLVASIISTRFIKRLSRSGLLEKYSYGEIMDELSRVRRFGTNDAKPMIEDGFWDHIDALQKELLLALDLAEEEPKSHRSKI